MRYFPMDVGSKNQTTRDKVSVLCGMSWFSKSINLMVTILLEYCLKVVLNTITLTYIIKI